MCRSLTSWRTARAAHDQRSDHDAGSTLALKSDRRCSIYLRISLSGHPLVLYLDLESTLGSSSLKATYAVNHPEMQGPGGCQALENCLPGGPHLCADGVCYLAHTIYAWHSNLLITSLGALTCLPRSVASLKILYTPAASGQGMSVEDCCFSTQTCCKQGGLPRQEHSGQ